MKSYKLFLVLAAAAAFTACTSEDGIKSASESSTEAMTFAVKNNNMSRVVGLETVSKDFGVWGYKSDGTADAVSAGTAPTVMENYLVGYIDTDAGAGRYDIPAGVTTTYGSPWLYEGFDDTYSNLTKQYLKYWDFSQSHYFFYGYAPYVKGADTPTFTRATRTLDFGAKPLMSGVAGATGTFSYMYACARVDKANFGHYVSMEFKRLYAQTQIGFYEDIPGYTVKILSTYDIEDKGSGLEAYNAATGEFGSVAFGASRVPRSPATEEPFPGITINKYDYIKQNYVYQVTPQVVFTETTGVAPSGNVTYSTPETRNAPFGWAAPVETAIGTTAASASMSPTKYNVVPVHDASATVVGFRMFVSFELTAEDTNEKIIVYNAPVFVPATYVDWEANHLYKYIFKITKNAGGTTAGPNDSSDPIDPTEDDALSLFPIVFNSLTVQDLVDGGTEEFNISD